jgi:hypothetical protein
MREDMPDGYIWHHGNKTITADLDVPAATLEPNMMIEIWRRVTNGVRAVKVLADEGL